MSINFNHYFKSFLVFLITILFAQDTHPYPPLYLVTVPTSGTLPRGSYSMEGLLVDNGGIVSRLSIGIFRGTKLPAPAAITIHFACNALF